jgi:hypothetical protein
MIKLVIENTRHPMETQVVEMMLREYDQVVTVNRISPSRIECVMPTEGWRYSLATAVHVVTGCRCFKEE